MSRIQHLVLFVVWLAGAVVAGAGISQSKHNLSAGGVNNLAASDGPSSGEMCIFCHTPHTSAAQPLWNRYNSEVTYIPYRSSTLKARVGQPTGASKLCLSCHDGTIALGRLRSRSSQIRMKTGVMTMPKGRSNLGTDLSDDHPVSFKYDVSLAASKGQLHLPANSAYVHLDGNGEVQCTSCHDPHTSQNEKFLVMNNTASALCLSCHLPTGWRQSSHSLSVKTWNGRPPSPWPHTTEQSVAANACENCHDPHGARGKQRLLNYAAEEENCYSCHNGNVAAKNVQAEFNKPSSHPVRDNTGVHDPLEKDLVSSEVNRHVECVDCHNAHASTMGASITPGGASGALAGVRGISGVGAEVSQVTYEYELCFRCHGDTAKGPARVSRQFPQINTRLEFQGFGGTNSFHPVVLPGRNPNVPSLKSPWTTASKIACSDCHNSDLGPNAGGSGPNGPHGSSYAPLLERTLSLADTGANPGNSALCFKCHNFGNGAWAGHVQHIGMTSCMTCHDPHGSPNTRLINFNPSIVLGARSFQALGFGHGTCTLLCHGKDHKSTY